MKSSVKGVALITALITAGLIATLAAQSLGQRGRLLRQEQMMRQTSHRQWLVRNAFEWAAERLREDGQGRAAVDHLAEPWALAVQNMPLNRLMARVDPSIGIGSAATEDGPITVSVSISDAQARLNLLNLLEGSAPSPTWMTVFTRLFELLGLPAEELDRLVQSLVRASAGTDPRFSGAAPLMPQRADDLSWLGLSPASLDALSPYVVVLPGRLPVNLNTAGATVLQAVLDLPATAVLALLQRRQERPLTELSETGLKEKVDASRHAVASQFFEVAVRIESREQWALRGRALFLRQGDKVLLLWRH